MIAASPDAAKAIQTAAETEKAAAAAAAETQRAVEEAKKAAETAAADVQKQIASAADPSVSVDKVKELAGSLNGDARGARRQADGGPQNQDGVVAGLKDQIGKSGPRGPGEDRRPEEVPRVGDDALHRAQGEARRGRRQDAKTSGLDVSKYTALIGK